MGPACRLSNRMLRSMVRRVTGGTLGTTALLLALEGCAVHGGKGAVTGADRLAPATAAVSDDDFAGAVRDLLVSTPGTPERAMRLGAVEARQMARADQRFKAHAVDRGLAAVSGGLYLLRTREATKGLFGPAGSEAIKAAAREMASRGDEGRARALYDLALQLGPDADVQGHIAALDAWMHDAVSAGGELESAGALERVAVRRRLLEPSDAAVADAAKATTDWIAAAMVLRDKFRKTRVQPPREEGAEAWRALETGPLVLTSVFLRDASVTGALAALDHAQARELLESSRAPFAAALEAAAQDPGAARCVDLLTQLRPLAGHDQTHDEEDFVDDRDLFGAAAFAVAGECYRLDPTVPQVALTVGVALEELGMAEATPAVLVDAVRAHLDPRVASEALALSLDAMANEEDAGDPDAARRAFKAAQPLLAITADKVLAGKVHPSAARLRASMGEIDLREGRIDEARGLLRQSVEEEKSGGVLLSLARIEWRDGQTQLALGHLTDALSAPDVSHDPALRGEILLLMSDVARDKGDVAAARTPLTEALKGLVQSRGGAAQDSDSRARVERVLSRVLDRFGAAQPAQRALERAYAAAPGDRRQVAQTIELQIGRAFVRGDLAAARDGLERALGTDLDADDLVYFALWVRLLERQGRVTTDGAPDRVFASIADDGAPSKAGGPPSPPRQSDRQAWVAPPARSAAGRHTAAEHDPRATTPIQKYEALFYSAMDRRASGDTKGGDELLRQVVAGTGLELSEVSLARDLLDPTRTQVGGPLPPDVQIP
jgi:tetratricopeptide (TPR) repeat protein